jgi:bla regulator protein BlaR1
MESLVLWLTANAFKGAILAIIFFATQLAISRHIKPRWKYIMWMLVAARLAMPPILPADFSFYNLGKFYGNDAERAVPAVISKVAPGVTHAAIDACGVLRQKTGKSFSLGQLIFFAWFIGAFSLLLVVLSKNWMIHFKVKKARSCTTPEWLELLKICKAELNVKAPLLLIETCAVKTPALLGFIKPRLLLPRGLPEKISRDELRLIFIHELMHLKRKDILLNWIITFIQIAQWFNPFAWLALAKWREARELACDESALNFLGKEKSNEYGRTIVRVLQFCNQEKGLVGMVGICENSRQIMERLTSIKNFNRPSSFMVALSIIILTFTGTVFLTEASEMKLLKSKAHSPTRTKESKMPEHKKISKEQSNFPETNDSLDQKILTDNNSDMEQKLEKTVIPEMKIRNAELSSVAAFLEAASEKYGLGKTGINFSFQLNGGQFIDAPKISIDARNITLKDAIKAVCEDGGLEWSVKEGQIYICPKSKASADYLK